MRKIVSIRFGSHLYGTATPNSDIDIKSVFVPNARAILLQRVKGSITNARPKASGEKNVAGEIDEESYAVQRFLALAAEGQTVALDILFAPEWAMTEPPSAEWREIIANRPRLLTRKSSAFLGYCRQQANKYGIKGSRVAAARKALQILDKALETYPNHTKLETIAEAMVRACETTEHMDIVPMEQAGGVIIQYWDVCGRRLQYTASIKHARDVMAKLVDQYGRRSLQAESNEGVDWKALSHAVRVGTQALELLGTGHVTFPLPNAVHVLDIKLGRLPYQQVSAEIEGLLEQVETAAARSVLRAEPDHAWIEDFVRRTHYTAVAGDDPLIRRAETFAVAAHSAVDQKRKYTDQPYYEHPRAVAGIVRTVPHTPEMLAAAYLHDVVEDTAVTLETIEAEFGVAVRDLVYWLTDVSKPEDGNRARRKALDREHSAAAPPEAQTIKLADLIDNTSTIETFDPDFAKVYRHEKRALLDVMNKGDATLLARARAQVA